MPTDSAPKGWKIQKLNDIFTLSAGGDVNKSLFSESQDLIHRYPIFANALTNKGLYGYSSDYKVEQESITITGRGDIGKVFYRTGKYTPIVRLVVGIPKDNISAKYMSYACSRIKFFNETTGVPQLTVPQVASYKVLTPPLEEQEKIAQILATWDSAIEQLTDLIAEKQHQKKALMQRLLTGKQRLPGFNKPWKNVRLGDIGKITSGKSKSSVLVDDGLFTVVDMGAVSISGRLLEHKKTNLAEDFLQTDDLIMPKDDIGGGNIIGKSILITENNKYVLGDHVFRLVVAEYPMFISYKINSFYVNKYMRRVCTGSAQLGLAKRDVEKCNLYIPADINEQKAIADVLMAADAEIDLLQQQLQAITEQKQGLMQQLLTGNIRVKIDKKS